MRFDIPILLLIYNRPDTTEIVLEAIRRVQPRQLFIAADGPSKKRADDQKKCYEVRNLINTVDWECEVKTLFRNDNLGCRQAISSAISWFYEQVEEGIILEDDCLPSQSFFYFCRELLEKYRNCDDVMVISGDNFQDGRTVTDESYYFSRYPHCWGWATWRSAWQKYDASLQGWPDFKESQLYLDIGADNPAFKSYWDRNFERVISGAVDTWDYIWTFSCWASGGLTAIPEKNLVQNIGFGPNATHTTSDCPKIRTMQAQELEFPLRCPSRIQRNVDADNYTDTYHYGINGKNGQSIVRRIVDKLKALF